MPFSSPVKGSAEEMIYRRLNQLSAEIWNLTERWCMLNKECCVDLENISNSRISFKASMDSNKKFFLVEQIIRDSDHLCSTLLPSFSSIVNNLAKSNQTILPLKCAIEEVAVRKDVSAASSSLPMHQICELYTIVPSLLEMFQKELEFKEDSIDDLAFWDDSQQTTVHLFSAILSSWQNYVYVDCGLLNRVYALVV